MFDLYVTDVVEVTDRVGVFDEVFEQQTIVLFRVMQFVDILINISDSQDDLVAQKFDCLALDGVVLREVFVEEGVEFGAVDLVVFFLSNEYWYFVHVDVVQDVLYLLCVDIEVMYDFMFQLLKVLFYVF